MYINVYVYILSTKVFVKLNAVLITYIALEDQNTASTIPTFIFVMEVVKH